MRHSSHGSDAVTVAVRGLACSRPIWLALPDHDVARADVQPRGVVDELREGQPIGAAKQVEAAQRPDTRVERRDEVVGASVIAPQAGEDDYLGREWSDAEDDDDGRQPHQVQQQRSDERAGDRPEQDEAVGQPWTAMLAGSSGESANSAASSPPRPAAASRTPYLPVPPSCWVAITASRTTSAP